MNIKKIVLSTVILSVFAVSQAMHKRPHKKKYFGNSPLHEAVLRGDCQSIKRNANLILKKNKENQTALHSALFLKFGAEKVVRQLVDILKKGYPREIIKFINSKDNRGLTVLHLAISKGSVEIAKSLIDLGADVTLVDKDEQTILHKILLAPKLEKNEKRVLIDKVLEAVKDESKYGRFLNKLGKHASGNLVTAFHIAASQGYVEIAESLIRAGADVTIESYKGRTALHMILCIRKVVERERFVFAILDDIKNKQKYEKIYGEHYEAIKNDFLSNLSKTDDDSAVTPLNIAISQGFVDIALALIEAGADVTVIDHRGGTVLHRTLWTSKIIDNMQRKRFVSAILEDIKNKNKYEKIYGKRYDWVIYDFLNTLGKKLDDSSASALNIAIAQGLVDVAVLLVEAGADVMIADSSGKTTLHNICLTSNIKNNEKPDLMAMMLEDIANTSKYEKIYGHDYEDVKQAFLNSLCEKEVVNKTASILNLAVAKGFVKVVRLLIKNGADVTIIDDTGKTALHIALWSTSIKNNDERKQLIAAILKDISNKNKYEKIYGKKYEKIKYAFLNKQSKKGKVDKQVLTALDLAISQGYGAIAKLFIEAGADATIVDSQGYNVLINSIISNNTEIFYYLLETNKLDVDQTDKKKYRTPLQWIVRLVEGSTKKSNNLDAQRISLKDAKDMIVELLERWASLTIKDAEGFNVLHQIILHGEHALLKTILEHESGYNDLLEAFEAKSAKGHTPLELILRNKIKKNRRDTINVLLKTRNEDNLTLREQAQYVKKWNIVRELEKLNNTA